MHDFLAHKLGEKDELYRPVALSLAIGSFVSIVLIDVLIGLVLFFCLIPPDTPTQTQYLVNASAAQAGRPECASWTDLTQYPDSGLPLRQYADYASFYIKPAPPGQLPLNGSQLYNLTLQLVCVAPDIPQTAASGATMSLAENFYGGWEIVGAVRTPCTVPQAPQFVAYQTASNFGLNCQSATERGMTLERYLRSTVPNVTESPSIWGTDCKIRNNPTQPRHMVFRTWWHWPAVLERPGFYGSVTVMCDGLVGVQQDFQNTYSRNMSASELATYTANGYLCTQYIGNDCVFFYSLRKWGKTQMEHMRITYDQLDCGNTMRFADATASGNPQWVLDRCAALQTPSSPNFVGMAMYRHLQDPTQNQTSGGDISLAVQLMQMLFDSPRAQNAPDISYLPLACPGRTSMLSEPIYAGSNRGRLNLLTLANIMSQYDETPMFTFQCTLMVPPTFMQRASHIWPYLSVAHTVVMTYMLRYVYLGLVQVRYMITGQSEFEEAAPAPAAGTTSPRSSKSSRPSRRSIIRRALASENDGRNSVVPRESSMPADEVDEKDLPEFVLDVLSLADSSEVAARESSAALSYRSARSSRSSGSNASGRSAKEKREDRERSKQYVEKAMLALRVASRELSRERRSNVVSQGERQRDHESPRGSIRI